MSNEIRAKATASRRLYAARPSRTPPFVPIVNATEPGMQGTWIRQADGTTSVIFLHGILSNGDVCWRHTNGTSWPELLANDPELPSLGVYLFTYKTGFFSGTYRLGDVVDSLKEFMALDGLLESRRLIFVCHSMGGIVARKYLVSRTADLMERNIAVGLFLIASPSLGSGYANWLAPLARFFDHTQADALRFQQTNSWLMDLDREFQNLKESRRLALHGKELIEDTFIVLKKFIGKQVVEPFSGARYFGEPYKVPHSDHMSIAKVDSMAAIQHRLLRQFIREFPDGGIKAVPSVRALGPIAARISDSISRAPDKDSGAPYAAYLFYVSRDRVSSLFQQVDAQTLAKLASRQKQFLPFGEPGALSAQDRDRRALVNQLAAVLDHFSKTTKIDDLREVVEVKGTLQADWYLVEAEFKSTGWSGNEPTLILLAHIGDYMLELTCTRRHFAAVIEENGELFPTSTGAVLFHPGRKIPLSGLIRLSSADTTLKTLQGTALYLVLRPLNLAL